MRLPTSLLVLLSSLMLLQVWDCGDYGAVAVRSFPGNMRINDEVKVTKGEAIHKLLDDNALLYNSTQIDFQDGKRRVPSCPDPLHNRCAEIPAVQMLLTSWLMKTPETYV